MSKLQRLEMAFQYDENAKEKISAYGNKLGNIGNQTEGSQLRKNSPVSRAAGETVSKIIKERQQELLAHLQLVTPAPKVTKSSLLDARKLFGDNFKKKVTLRKSGHLGAYEEISLLQFDPNFTSSEVTCRHPSCSTKNSEAAKSGNKRDLFLCPTHQQVLRNSISNLFAKEKITLSNSTNKHGLFAGYTSVISVLDSAYHGAKESQTLKGKSLLIQEAILNVRNFLIITNCLLNPDDDNLGIALPPVFQILHLILKDPDKPTKSVVGLIHMLRDVIEMVLFSFGVIYCWVALALRNPATQIGFGVGMILGAGAFFLGPWSGAAGVTIGGTAGGLIGNGIHSFLTKKQQNQRLQRFIEEWREAGGDIQQNGQPNNQDLAYIVEADAEGRLTIALAG